MAEEFLHDMLGHAGVDQSGAQGVPELVCGYPCRLAGFVAHVDGVLPRDQALT